MPLQVVQLAMCQCTMGNAKSPLVVTSNFTVFACDLLAATIMDYAPILNIVPFGTCKLLTAAASGVPTPCVPATTAPWMPGSAKTKIGGFPALLSSDKLVCSVGGMISISNPGQRKVKVN